METKDLLKMAYIVAEQSHDPSTQLGAVLDVGGVYIFGINDFPHGVQYKGRMNIREIKLKYIVHAEHSVILKAAKGGYATEGTILYCPWFACNECSKAIVSSGIKRIIGHQQMFDLVPERWKESIEIGNIILDEGGVKREYYDGQIEGINILIDGQRWRT